MTESELLQLLTRPRATGRWRAALLKNAAGMAGIPILFLTPFQPHPFFIALLRQVDTGHRLGVTVANLVDPTIASVPNFGLMAVAGLLVVPINQVDVAVGTEAQVNKASPGVIGEEKVAAVRGNVAGAFWPGDVH